MLLFAPTRTNASVAPSLLHNWCYGLYRAIRRLFFTLLRALRGLRFLRATIVLDLYQKISFERVRKNPHHRSRLLAANESLFRKSLDRFGQNDRNYARMILRTQNVERAIVRWMPCAQGMVTRLGRIKFHFVMKMNIFIFKLVGSNFIWQWNFRFFHFRHCTFVNILSTNW